MIRLVEDIEIQELIKTNNPEALRRYWVFLAYGSPTYCLDDSMNLTLDEEDEYIEDFLLGESCCINIGKFDKAAKVLSMDEWTSLNSFVSTPSEAEGIARYICEHDFSPEEIIGKFPDIELIGFYWIDGWWELFGDLELAYSMLTNSPLYCDTDTSPFLSKECDENRYSEDREKLRQLINKSP